jgi:predicted phosphoribosyltransferase
MLMLPLSTARYGIPLLGCDDRDTDRAAAGRQLAELLLRYRGSDAVVLALPPGGIVVAGALAHALRLPLDVLLERTFVLRQYPTLSAGALSEGGGLCFNKTILRLPGVAPQALWREARRTWHELAALALSYRRGRALPPLQRRPLILVDDGLDDGLGILAALSGLRHYHPHSVIVATPWARPAVRQLVGQRAGALVALAGPPDARSPWRQPLGDDDAAILLERYRYDNPIVRPSAAIAICPTAEYAGKSGIVRISPGSAYTKPTLSASRTSWTL